MTRSLSHPSRRMAMVLLGAAMACPSVMRASGLMRVAGRAFGTGWQVTAGAGPDPDHLRRALDRLFEEIDRDMSPWRPDSALAQFNAGPAGWMAAGRELLGVTRAALRLSGVSGGAFDPTVGPLVGRWGFGPIDHGQPGREGVVIRPGAIGKTRDDATLDLCGIAKGRALDRAADVLTDLGYASALIDIGGELRATGTHPSGRDWQVAVEGPDPGGPSAAVLRLAPGQAVATSGIAAQGYSLGPRAYGHIIDPALGRPADNGLHSVTVLADSAMAADGWATALYASGPIQGVELAESRGIAALFVRTNGIAPRPTEAIRAAIL